MPPETLVESAGMTDADAQTLLTLLKELTGISIPIQKKMMVLFRLRKRMAELNQVSIPCYVAKVRQDRSEQQVFINLLTTNETCFFRTPRIWQYFRDQYLAEFQASAASEVLRVWSAAASTGEEACTIAMVCHDAQLRCKAFRYQVLATDVDTDVLAKAKSGQFGERTVDKLRNTDPEVFTRYFKTNACGAYEADEAIRKNITFARHNLMNRPQFPAAQNIVFLRNVLIYFGEAEQITILRQLSVAMAVGATLILGESDSIAALDTPFTFVQPQIYRKMA